MCEKCELKMAGLWPSWKDLFYGNVTKSWTPPKMPTMLDQLLHGIKPLPRTQWAAKLGLHRERDLSQDCADFYVLEKLAAVHGYAPAIWRLDKLERSLCREFTLYLDMAVGGELRHAVGMSDEHGLVLPKELDLYWKAVRKLDSERSSCWQAWVRLTPRLPQDRYLLASQLFVAEGWNPRAKVGGAGWSTAAKVLNDRVYGILKQKNRIFVDRCWTLEHNYGVIFDKIYERGVKDERLNLVLRVQANDDYQRLSRFACPEVRNLWRDWQSHELSWYDPTWWGTQSV